MVLLWPVVIRKYGATPSTRVVELRENQFPLFQGQEEWDRRGASFSSKPSLDPLPTDFFASWARCIGSMLCGEFLLVLEVIDSMILAHLSQMLVVVLEEVPLQPSTLLPSILRSCNPRLPLRILTSFASGSVRAVSLLLIELGDGLHRLTSATEFSIHLTLLRPCSRGEPPSFRRRWVKVLIQIGKPPISLSAFAILGGRRG